MTGPAISFSETKTRLPRNPSMPYKNRPVGLRHPGAAIRDARVAAGLSQTELATKAGIQQATLSLWELEKRQPHVSSIENIAKALEIDPNIIRHGVWPEPPKIDEYEAMRLCTEIISALTEDQQTDVALFLAAKYDNRFNGRTRQSKPAK